MEEKLIDGIFEKLPSDLVRNILMLMDVGNVLYLCAHNDPLNAQCTEQFWKQKVGQTYGRKTKTGWTTWRDMALELYLQSQEDMCFECSQYQQYRDIRQCEECGVDLCRLCGDSESGLCMECHDETL